jgi:hypothetical protein
MCAIALHPQKWQLAVKNWQYNSIFISTRNFAKSKLAGISLKID